MSHNNYNTPILDLGPVSSAIIVGLVLFVALPLAAVAKWVLKH